jgi:hypothetical protein
MPYDPEQLAVDVDYLTTLPQWQDEAKRPEFIRQVALQAGPNLDPQAHGEFANALWERSKGNLLQRGAEFVARGGEEVLKSIPASGGAAVFAASDALGITDTGSGTRLMRGVADLVDATGQRLKQLGGGEILGMNLLPGQSKQAVRDQTLDALKQSLDQGLYPAGLERWMSGEFDGGAAQPDAETVQWIDLMTRGIAERAVAANHMGKVKPEKVREWLQSDRNPAFADSDIPGQPGPRELLADYLATRDPSSWEAFQARVSETDSQRTTRLRRFAAEGEVRATTATMPEGLGKDLAVRSMDMQTSPIDLATAALPIFRGRAALQAARRGGAGAQMLRGMEAEGLQEGATEYLSDPNASPERVLEAAGLGAVGQGVVSAPMAGAGALLRRRDNLSPNDPTTSPTQTTAPTQPPAAGQPVAAAPAGTPVSPLSGIAERGGRIDPTLPDDTGELTAEDVEDLETLRLGDLETGRRQPILQGLGQDVSDPMRASIDEAVRTGRPFTPEEIAFMRGQPPPAQAPAPTAPLGAGQAVPLELMTPAQVAEIGSGQDVQAAVQRYEAARAANNPREGQLAEAAIAAARSGTGPNAQQIKNARMEAVSAAVAEGRPVNAQAMESWANQTVGNGFDASGNIPRRGIPDGYQKQGDVYTKEAVSANAQNATVRRGLTNLQGGNRSNAGSSTLPGEAAAALVSMAQTALRAGQNFAQWAASMVQRFGEAVRQYLQGAWQAATQTSEVGALNFTSALGPQLQAAANNRQPRSTTVNNRQLLTTAHAAAARGSSTQMVPIRRVYEEARRQNPALTPEQFQAQVMAEYEAGTVLLEGSGSRQEAESAGLRIDGTPVGTAVRMMVLGNPALQNPASGATRAAGGTSPQGFTNLNPGARTGGFLNTEILAEGAALLQQGFTTFANWSKAMLSRFGQGIRDALTAIWQQITSPQTNAAQNVRMGRAQGSAPVTMGQGGFVTVSNGKVQGMTTSAVDVLHNDSAELPKPTDKVSNDTVAKNLQEAALTQWGDIITSDNITPEQEAILVANGVEEFVAAFRASGKTAADWYTTNIESAMAVANVIHEELKSDQAAQAVRVNGQPIFRNKEDAQLALYLAMAITSQNLNVNQNTTYAEEQFQIFKATGKFNSSRLYGEKAKSISANLDLANTVLETLGWQTLHEIIGTTYTVRELSGILSKWTGKNLKIAGRMEDQVQGAAIFGPKIGQGFLQNLMGNYLPVTIDLWMRRTWGRWTGDVLGDGLTGDRLARLVDEVRQIGIALPASLARVRPVVRLTEKGKPFRTMSEDFLDRVENEEDLREQINDYAKEVVAIWGRKYKSVQSGITKAQQDALLAGTVSMDAVSAATLKNEEQLNRQWESKTDKPKGKGAKEIWKTAQRAKSGRTYKLTTDQWNGTVNGVKNVGPKLKPQWALAANVIRTQLKPIDAPSDQDREVISRIVNKIRVELEAQGIKVSNADIQAVLWYPEKDLWAKLRGEEESNLKQSYEDEFLKLARERGVGAEAEAVAARVRAARTGDSTEQVTDGGIRQGSGRADKTQGGGFKNLTSGARTGGFLNAEILAEGAALLQQGFTTFANWSKAMLSRFGQGIRDALTAIWQQITSPQTNAAQNVRMGRAQGSAPVTMGQGGFVTVSNGKVQGMTNAATRALAPVLPLHVQGTPFRVKNLGLRSVLTGSPLPQELVSVLDMTENERQAVMQASAQIGRDVESGVNAQAKRTGRRLADIWNEVNAIMEGVPGAQQRMLAIDPELAESSRRARNMLDDLSAAVAQTLPAGTLLDTITQNVGQWMRRGYAAFDAEANWNFDSVTKAAAAGKMLGGKDARKILADARAYLRSQNPQAGRTVAEWNGDIEADMRDLMDRDQWEAAMADGSTVRKGVSSFMKRKDIAPEIRALMGEETNPLIRYARSAKFQAQIVARHHGQIAMRNLGLTTGLFSTERGGVYTTQMPVDTRWSGMAGVWTTPQLMKAFEETSSTDLAGKDIGGMLVNSLKALGNEAKLNKVALNPGSWVVNILGNVVAVVQSGDVFYHDFVRRVKEARGIVGSGKTLRATNGAALALQDAQRSMLQRLRAAGVTGSSITLSDIEASLPRHLLAWAADDAKRNAALGAAKGAIFGQSLGRVLAAPGRIVGGAIGGAIGARVGVEKIQAWQQAVANYVMTGPDALARVTGWLTNYETALASGLTTEQANVQATQKTLNTFPNYAALPALLRSLSRIGFAGSFIAFQYEVWRNYGWNVKYAVEEINSGNAAQRGRGLRRLAGLTAVSSLAMGGLGALLTAAGLASGADDERNKLFRKWFGRPWEKDAVLAFSKFDGDKVAYYNTSYLLPQVTMVEVAQAMIEGESPEDKASRVISRLWEQFAASSVHLGPLIEAYTGQTRDGFPISQRESAAGRAMDQVDYLVGSTMESGFSAQFERVARALMKLDKHGRSYTVEGEIKYVAGVREQTREWEKIVQQRYGQFSRDYNAARTQAKNAISENAWGAKPAAIATANERIGRLQTELATYEKDMARLGISRAIVLRARKNSGLQKLRPVRLTREGNSVEADPRAPLVPVR